MQSEAALADREIGRLVLRRNAESLIEYLAAVQEEVTEKRVHEARVQSRRMRAALETFRDSLPPGPFRQVYQEVRRLTRLCGKPRETAVNCALLAGLCAEGVTEGRVCRQLVRKLRRKLASQEKRLRKELRALDVLRLSSRLEFLLAAVEPESGRRGPDAPESGGLPHPSPRFLAQAYEVFLKSAVLPSGSLELWFAEASDEELHTARIAAKKLRYSLEFLHPFWPGGLESHIVKARSLQEAGGLFHDWCMLCDWLGRSASRTLEKTAMLMACAVERKNQLRGVILPVLDDLRRHLSCTLESQRPAMILARGRKPGQRGLAREGTSRR